MIGGDLDEAPLPAEVYVVWEELIAIPGPRHTLKRFGRLWLRRRAAAALDLYRTNDAAVRTLWDLWEDDQPVTLVTYLPPEVAAHLPARLEREEIPHVRLLVDQPLHMARTIAFLPGVARIVHSIPDHHLLYGPKGFLVPPDAPELIREILP
ncbi:hypothetical protein OIU91_16895 [Streptomyces sp. NBC_01456]|uniref:hypothetical protein n=1 Tax=Streptomyces sp. NBC_01456 TaxID=2975868 RepID=UPI002E2F8196|nr:hypothetical protein [Streptomyces sp. NBC_01456]